MARFWINKWNIAVIVLFIYTTLLGTHLQVRPVGRFSRLMAQTTRTHARMCLWGFRWYCFLFEGLNSQNSTTFWVCEEEFSSQTCRIVLLQLLYYRNYCLYCNWILHNNKDHQIHFMGGVSVPPNTSKMADGRYVEKSKKNTVQSRCKLLSVKLLYKV